MIGARRSGAFVLVFLLASIFLPGKTHADTVSQATGFSASGSLWGGGDPSHDFHPEGLSLSFGQSLSVGGFTAGVGLEARGEASGEIGVDFEATFNEPSFRLNNPYEVTFTRPDLGGTKAGEGFRLQMNAISSGPELTTQLQPPSFRGGVFIRDLNASIEAEGCALVACKSGSWDLIDSFSFEQDLIAFDNSSGSPSLKILPGSALETTYASFPKTFSVGSFVDATIYDPSFTETSIGEGNSVQVDASADIFSLQANISNVVSRLTQLPLNESFEAAGGVLEIGYETINFRVGPKLSMGLDSEFTLGEFSTELIFDKPVGMWIDEEHTSYVVIDSLALENGEQISDIFLLHPGETVTSTPVYQLGEGYFTNTTSAQYYLNANLSILSATFKAWEYGETLGPLYTWDKDLLLGSTNLSTEGFGVSFQQQEGSRFSLTSSPGECREAGASASGFIFDPLCGGTLTKTDSGTLELFAENSYTGGTVLANGTVVVERDANLGDVSGSITFDGGTLRTRNFDADTTGIITSRSVLLNAGGGTFDTNGLDSTLAGEINGVGSFTKTSTGTLTLSGVNTYTGATNLEGGTLSLSGAGRLSDVTALNLDGGTLFDMSVADGDRAVGSLAGSGDIQLGANTMTTGGNHLSTEFSGLLAGSGGLTKVGSGTQTLSGINTYMGATRLNGGALSVSSDANLGNGGALAFDGGELKTTAAFSSSRSISLDSGGGTFNTNGFDAILSGVIGGEGSFRKTSEGILALAAINTYTGATRVEGGVLSLAGEGSLSSVTALDIEGGSAFDISAADDDRTVGSLAGAGNVLLGANSLTAGVNNADTRLSGEIRGAGAVIKTGTGNWTLTGANTYSGGTRVSGGTLTGTSASLRGGIVNEAAVVFDQADDGTYAGNMDGSGSLTKSNDGNLVLSGTNTYSGGTLVSGGILTGNTNSLQGQIVNQSAAVFDQATEGVYSGDMSGGGKMVKSNAGNLVLSGTNTYSGGTLVSGGILTGNTTSLQGDIANHAAVVFDQATSGIYSGDMGGSGSLTKSNAGSLTLAGANSYTGGTLVSGGILSGNTTSLQGDITNEAVVLFDQAAGGTYAGNMGGNGSLTKANGGNLILAGSNNYSGGTTVSGGALSGNTTSLQGDIANDAAVIFDQTKDGTYAGDMRGSGMMVKLNAGNLILSGSNSYAGSTIVAGGILTGNTTSLQGDIANNTTVVFDQAADGIFAGDMRGSGVLVKLNAGNLILSGSNSYAGSTIVAGGILTGNTTSLQGDIANNTTVVFDQAADGIFAGDMNGSGTMIKESAGVLNLTGASTYSGPTTINEGGLRVNGSLASDVMVAAHGLLGGNGTISGTVTNQGVLAPGNSIDTLVVGNYVSEPGSIHEVEVTARGEGDLISATANATLNGGEVDVLTDSGETSEDYLRRTFYDIVAAGGGISGVYDSVKVDLAELSPMLHYDDPDLVELILIRNDIDFAEIAGARTDNQRSVGKVLTEASLSAFLGDLADILDVYVDGLSIEEERRAALDGMGGQRLHTAIPFASFGLTESFQGAVGRRMDQLHLATGGTIAAREPLGGVMLAMAGDVSDIGPVGRQERSNNHVWIHLHGTDADVDSDVNAAGYGYQVFGAAVGADFPVGRGTHLGLTAGFGTSDLDTTKSDTAEIHGTQVGIYGNYEHSGFYIDGIISYALNRYDTKRRITLADQIRTADGDYDGEEWSAAAEIGHVGTVHGFNVQPFFGSRYLYLDEDGFTEEGAGDLSLQVEDRSTYSWKIFPGLRVNRPVAIGGTARFIPEISAKWLHEMGDENDVMTARFVGAPGAGSFQVEGIEMDRDSFELGGGIKVAGELFQASLNYAAEINGEKMAHSISGGLKLYW